MDEESLEAAIEQYKQQFLQVQSALQAAGEKGNEDLVKLRDDLVELIHVSEGSLLSLKKSKLLQFIEEQEASGSQEFDDAYEQDTYQEGYNKEIGEEDCGDIAEEDDITGTKCRVPFTQEWGVTEHHNAMVFRVEMLSTYNKPDQAQVRVLFLNPTHMSMVPCPYFLDGNCRFTEQECRFSHGCLVSIDDLKPFKEPDFTDIQVGQQCLARYSDGVWYKSTIKSIDEDSHKFTVHYDTYNTDANLGVDEVFPLELRESESVSESDDRSSLSSDSETSKVTNDDDVMRYPWKPTGGPISLGDWEQHTTGIGSRLMAKMGYIFGKGLGKDGSGRVEPIEVVILPQGKSLDKCAELRKKKKLKEPFKKKRKKNTSSKCVDFPNTGKTSDVFQFINHKLGGKKGNIHDIRVPIPGSKDGEFDVRKRSKSTPDDREINWNIQLFKIHEEIAGVKKHLKKQEEALKRHSTQDSKNSVFFKEKRDDVQHRLNQLHAKEKLIQQKIQQKHQHKKLTIF